MLYEVITPRHCAAGQTARPPRQIAAQTPVITSYSIHYTKLYENLVIAGVPPEQQAQIQALAEQYGLLDPVSRQRENSMACVALPTCPLAMAEAERFLPAFVTRIEALLAKHGVPDDSLIFRVTGCPNGCVV